MFIMPMARDSRVLMSVTCKKGVFLHMLSCARRGIFMEGVVFYQYGVGYILTG